VLRTRPPPSRTLSRACHWPGSLLRAQTCKACVYVPSSVLRTVAHGEIEAGQSVTLWFHLVCVGLPMEALKSTCLFSSVLVCCFHRNRTLVDVRVFMYEANEVQVRYPNGTVSSNWNCGSTAVTAVMYDQFPVATSFSLQSP
jgi:hypothetical protein